MSFWECPKCGGIPGVTFCCTDAVSKPAPNKTKMPEPVAWVRRHPDGALSAEYLEDGAIEPVRKESGAWLPMITTDQAEAYAQEVRREALLPLIQGYVNLLESGRDRIISLGGDCDPVDVMEASDPYLRAARALIPQEGK